MHLANPFKGSIKILRKSLFIILIVFVSTTISLLLAEKMIRYANPQFTYQQAKQVSLRAYEKSDLLPFKLAANLNTDHIGNTHEFSYTIRTNSAGYRMEEFSAQKPKDEYRILMLGDSMTFGFGVEENQSFVQKVKEKLNIYLKAHKITNKKVQLINAGFMDGKSPDSYYLYLKEEGLKLKPDLIIVNYFINNDVLDLDDNIWEKVDDNGLPLKISSRTAYIDPPYYRLQRPYQNWKLVVPILRDSHLWILFATAWETKAPDKVQTIKNLLGTKPLPVIEADENANCLFKEKCSPKMNELLEKFYLLAQAKIKLGRANDVPLIVSLIPANPQVEEQAKIIDAEKRYPKLTTAKIAGMLSAVEPQKTWREFFANQDVAVIDPLPYMADIGWQSFYFNLDGHPTVSGNEALSQAYFDFLTENWKILSKIKK